jgi:hypothetical protein
MQPEPPKGNLSRLLGGGVMAKVNTFFCDCGKTIGRPANVMPDKDDSPIYSVVPWYAREGDGKIHGVRCGKCRQWWQFIEPKQWVDFADVRKSCAPNTCSTMDHINGRC